MHYDFANKVALVTGAGSGLGLATARAFAASGASVVLADSDTVSVRAAADRLSAENHAALAVTCDVTDDAQVRAMIAHTIATFGRLDMAYNNAGIQNVLADTADATREDFDRVVGVNLRGVWSCMKYELQRMREQGSGAIVNCSSIGGIVGGAGRATYHAAKYGVIGLTTSAALEYAPHGIRINAVCPGMIDTPMSDAMKAAGQADALNTMLEQVPLGRLGRADEIADAVLWLCSSSASLVVGHALVVDGGYTIH
jgi:NAD(P)-dependent dehydrogenase (short-subunit alcohol dehydrogenase family)